MSIPKPELDHVFLGRTELSFQNWASSCILHYPTRYRGCVFRSRFSSVFQGSAVTPTWAAQVSVEHSNHSTTLSLEMASATEATPCFKGQKHISPFAESRPLVGVSRSGPLTQPPPPPGMWLVKQGCFWDPKGNGVSEIP